MKRPGFCQDEKILTIVTDTAVKDERVNDG